MMDYIVTRQSQTITNISKSNIKELNLSLNEFVSFTVYGNSSDWSKKGSHNITPVGYVIVTNLEFVFPPSILLPLLSQSNNIPLLFAIITSTGHVYLEEFTDALKSLDWNLPVGLIPNTITSNSTTMLESLTNNSNNSNINNIVNDDNDNDSNNINKNNLDEDIISNETSNIISNEEIINEQSNKVVSQLNEFIS